MVSKNFISKLLLVILLAGCITGLVIVTMHQCNDKEGYKSKMAENLANNACKRVGNGLYPVDKKVSKSGPVAISKPLSKNMLHLGVM